MRKIGLALLVIVVVAICSYLYLYQDHRDVVATDASVSLNSQELLSVFNDSDIENDQTVLDQVIEIKGEITSINGHTLILDQLVFIEMVNAIDVNEGSTVTIKGRCLGYDDLLGEIKIDQGILIVK